MAQCDYCGTDYLECPDCKELIVIDDFNKVIEYDCSFKFIQHAEHDRKGMIYEGELEIISDRNCNQCGCSVDEVDENIICTECAEYNRISEDGE